MSRDAPTSARTPSGGPRRSRLRTLLVRAAAFVAAAAAAASAPADAQNRSYQVHDNESINAALREFQKKGERGEWRAAILELQKVLDTPPASGAVVTVPDSRPRRYESAWRAAVRLFESMPPDARTAWEQLSRRSAEELLARGLRLRREEDLSAAARRFPARDVRRRAHDALAHLALVRGDYDRAARETESLLECVEPGDRAEAVARLAFARSRAGDAEGTSRAALVPDALLDTKVPGPAGPEPLRAFVARAAEYANDASRRFAGARMASGDSHGTGLSAVPPRPAVTGWEAPTGYRQGLESDDGPQYQPQYRPVAPLVAQGAVFLNSGLALTALDLSKKGSVVWRYESPQTQPQWRENLVTSHSAAYSDGVVYAALATRSDAPLTGQKFNGNIIIYSLVHRALHAFDARTGAVLWSHDTQRLAGNPDAAEIERESVASAPLLVGDDLIVVTWSYGMLYHARLACFDRRTGATRWRASLVHGQQEMNLFGRPVKEIVVPQPSERDGLVYASTGLGIAAAVDRVTGAVVWLSEYGTTEIPPTQYWYQTQDRPVTWRISPIAATRTAVVMAPPESASLIAFDPRTGARLWEREQSRGGLQSTWFLGVTGGRAYTLGTRLFAWDLATGAPAWRSPDAGKLAPEGEDARPALGRGILTEDSVHVPTPRGIVRLSTSTGIADRTTPMPPRARDDRTTSAAANGDLSTADGALIVAREQSVECHYVLDDLVRRMDARVIAEPDDAGLRLDAGQVFASAGDLDKAAGCLEHGLRIASKRLPGTPAATETALRDALAATLLDRAKSRRSAGDGPGARADLLRTSEVAADRALAVRALFDLADFEADLGRDAACDAALSRLRSEFADVVTSRTDDAPKFETGVAADLRLAQRAADRGDLESAVERWLRLLDERPEAPAGDVSVAGAVRLALDTLVSQNGDPARSLLAAACRRRLDAAVAAGDLALLRTLTRTSPDLVVAGEAALAASRALSAAGSPRDAAAALGAAVLRPIPSPLRTQVLWELAQAYTAIGETARERATLRRLVQEGGADRLPDGRTAADAARAALEAPRFREAAPTLPDPQPPLALRWESSGGPNDATPVPAQIQGVRPPQLDDSLLFAQGDVLRCVDAATGKDRWRERLQVEARAYFGAGGNVVVAGEDQRAMPRVVRVDSVSASTGETAWTRRLGGRFQHAAAALGLVYVLRQDTGERGERVSWVTALSADTGDKVAERALAGATHPMLTCAGDAVVVYELLQGAAVRRRATTLDAVTLEPRGTVEVPGHVSPFSLPVPGTPLVATSARVGGVEGVAAIDTSTGGLAWQQVIRGRSVKKILAVPGGVVVSDDGNHLRRIDAATGAFTWDVAPAGADAALKLGYEGEASDGDLVIATLVPQTGSADAQAVALDAATGAVRWRAPIPAEGRMLPRPEILQHAVAYEINLRGPRGAADCRVMYLDRATGRDLGTVRHPVIGSAMQRVFHHGAWVVLLAIQRPDLAVYSGAAAEAR